MATANQKVGSVYEVGIEGVGYMLADNPQRPVRRQTGVLDVQPPGSDDPLSERIGRYDFIGQSDWTGGEGQEMLDRPASDATRYFYSEGLDPFDVPGQITCLPAVAQLLSDNYEWPQMVTLGTDLLVRTAAQEYTVIEHDGTTTAVATGLNVATVYGPGFAGDGRYWYLTNAADVHRGQSGEAGAAWSTENVTLIAWCSDRLMGFDGLAAPVELFEFSPTGTATLVTTLPANYIARGLGGGNGFVWWGAFIALTEFGSGNNSSYIGYWQVDSSPQNTGIALNLPAGEIPTTVYYYLGNVFIGTAKPISDATNKFKAYRCVPSDGLLTPQVIADDLPSAVNFSGAGKYVAFTWGLGMQRTGAAGIGVLDLETGGIARWHPTTTTGTATYFPLEVTTWLGQFVIAHAGNGVYGRDSDALAAPTYVDGFLETSVSDLGTPALKHLDEIQVSTLPLPTGGGASSVAVAYSIDLGDNFTALATYNTVNATRHATEITTAVVAPSVQTRVTLNATVNDADKPVVTAVLAKTHATLITDEIIELPINCDDYIRGVHNVDIAEDSGPGKGMARYRALQDLIGTKILFQDVDWKFTGETSLCEVVGVESTAVQIFNQSRMVNDVTSHVAIVTLRRPFTA